MQPLKLVVAVEPPELTHQPRTPYSEGGLVRQVEYGETQAGVTDAQPQKQAY